MTSRFSGKRRPCIQSFWTPCLLQEGCTALQNLWKKKKTGSQRCIANYRVWRRANHQASIFLLKWMCERNLGCVEENFRFLLLLVFCLFLTFSSSFFLCLFLFTFMFQPVNVSRCCVIVGNIYDPCLLRQSAFIGTSRLPNEYSYFMNMFGSMDNIWCLDPAAVRYSRNRVQFPK